MVLKNEMSLIWCLSINRTNVKSCKKKWKTMGNSWIVKALRETPPQWRCTSLSEQILQLPLLFIQPAGPPRSRLHTHFYLSFLHIETLHIFTLDDTISKNSTGAHESWHDTWIWCMCSTKNKQGSIHSCNSDNISNINGSIWIFI